MDQWKVTIWSDETGAFPNSPHFSSHADAVAYVEEEQAWDERNHIKLKMTYTIEEVV